MKFRFWPIPDLTSSLSRTTLTACRQIHQVQTRQWFVYLAVGLIVAGQIHYWPERLSFLRELQTYAGSQDAVGASRRAYGAANYDLLEWVRRATPADTTLLLLTASPRTYGDASYVLYHRAMYHLYPRSVWWAAPVPPARYPVWWSVTDLSQENVLTLAKNNQATAILANGFARPPVSGPSISFDEESHLIFLDDRHTGPEFGSGLGSDRRLLVTRTLGALLAMMLWGDLIIQFLAKWLPSRSIGRQLALAWLLGCGVTSFGLFLLLWLGVPLASAVAVLSWLGCLLWLVVRRNSIAQALKRIKSVRRLASRRGNILSQLTLKPWSTLFVVVISVQVGLVGLAALVSPLTAWDAWVNWASKANVLFIEQALSPQLHHDLARLPTNLDYPLMLPLVESWFYSWLGQIYEPSVGLISFLFYSALLLLFYHVARQFASSTAALGFTAWLATVPRLERMAHSGLADIPLAAGVLLSFLWVYHEFRYERTRPTNRRAQLQSVAILALSAGLLPWLKTEGWLWLCLISVTWLTGLAARAWRRQLSIGQVIVRSILYLLIALSIVSLWQYFLASSGVYRYTFLPLTLTNLWGNLPRLPVIVLEMAKRLFNPYWNFIWLFVALALLARSRQVLQTDMGWLILPVVGFLGLVSFGYVFSRFEPYLAHLNNSSERLILQASPLALWWLLGQGTSVGWLGQAADRTKFTNDFLLVNRCDGGGVNRESRERSEKSGW